MQLTWPTSWILVLVVTPYQVRAQWPDGTYGLPMPQGGCPAATDFHWRTGYRIHQTEYGSYGSTPVHLAGVDDKPKYSVTQHFCMKLLQSTAKGYPWAKGEYCIFKKDRCPSGFNAGWVYWDDAAPFLGGTIQNYSGVLPEGEYNRNTKIWFCCRRDGSALREIVMPTESPFYLIKHKTTCQQVKGMDVTEEWVYWKDEASVNLNAAGGAHPASLQRSLTRKFTRLYYCYYRKTPENLTLRGALIAVYVVAGVVGFVLAIFLLVCLVQRSCDQPQKAYDSQGESSAGDTMLRPLPCATPCAVPVTSSETDTGGTPSSSSALTSSHPSAAADHVLFRPTKTGPPRDVVMTSSSGRHVTSRRDEAAAALLPPVATAPPGDAVAPPAMTSYLQPGARDSGVAPPPEMNELPPSYDDVLRGDEWDGR